MDPRSVGYYANRLGEMGRYLADHGYPSFTEAQRRIIMRRFGEVCGENPDPNMFVDVVFSARPDLDKPTLRRELGLVKRTREMTKA